MKSTLPGAPAHPPRGAYSRRSFLQLAGAAAGYGLASFAKGDPAPGRGLRPNILLVFPDQLRRDWNGLNPNLPVQTPNLERLAAEGTRFTQAYCPSPLCAPSRACLAQGRRYGRTGVLTNRDNNPDGVETFYQHLRSAGYRVGCLGKADLRKGAFDWGPDGLHRVGTHRYFEEWGFSDGFDSEGKMAVVNGVQNRRKKGEPLDPYARMLAERHDGSLEAYLTWYKHWLAANVENHNYGYTVPCELAESAYNDNWVGANALGLLENRFPADQPWFLQVNFPGPHDPEDVTSAMASWYRDAAFPLPINNDQLSAEVHQSIRRNYSAMVQNIDRWLGRLVAAVEKRGELDNTLIVFSSDHGEMLGDHNCWGKSVPFESAAAVPLTVRGPGVRRGRVHEGVATTLDLPATFLDFAGVDVPATMDSRSLRPTLAGSPPSTVVPVTAGLEGWKMACDGRFKLIQGLDPFSAHGYGGGVDTKKTGDEEPAAAPRLCLFDLAADPTELVNVADRHPDEVARLAVALAGQAAG